MKNIVVVLQQRLEAQEVVIHELRVKLELCKVNQNQHAVPQDVPPLSPVSQPIVNLFATVSPRGYLYEKFRRMRALEFEGSSDLLV